jgi:hypothetical protein
MNESSLNQESNEPTPESTMFGLPRPLAGALIGILIFVFIIRLSQSTSLEIVEVIFLAPGYLASWIIADILSGGLFESETFTYTIRYGISGLPPAILGLLFFSKRAKVLSIILIIVYFVLSLVIGLLIYTILFTG